MKIFLINNRLFIVHTINAGALSWEDGSPVDYTNFADGQLDSNSSDLCVFIDDKNLYWLTNNCTSQQTYDYICQAAKVYDTSTTLMTTTTTSKYMYYNNASNLSL